MMKSQKLPSRALLGLIAAFGVAPEQLRANPFLPLGGGNTIQSFLDLGTVKKTGVVALAWIDVISTISPTQMPQGTDVGGTQIEFDCERRTMTITGAIRYRADGSVIDMDAERTAPGPVPPDSTSWRALRAACDGEYDRATVLAGSAGFTAMQLSGALKRAWKAK